MNHHGDRRLVLVTMGLALLATGCDTGKQGSFAGGGEATMSAPPSVAPEAAPATTATAPLAAGSVVLSADGLGPVTFGTQAAVAMGRLTQALGRAEATTVIPAGSGCAATRIFRWKNFAVLINEVSARSGGKPGLVGWRMGGGAPASPDMRTDNGIGIGSTVAALKAAYGKSVTITGPLFEIAAPNGAIGGELDGPGDATKVRVLQAGTVCGM